jgi:hypothetical protein
MEKEVIVTSVETDEASRNQRIAEIVSGGFYEFLKTNGYLRKSANLEKRVEKVLGDAKRIHDASPEV